MLPVACWALQWIRELGQGKWHCCQSPLSSGYAWSFGEEQLGSVRGLVLPPLQKEKELKTEPATGVAGGATHVMCFNVLLQVPGTFLKH